MMIRAIDRPPFNSPWVHGIVRRWWLPAWFVAVSSVGVWAAIRAQGFVWFFDARLYLEATKAWLNGQDPWSVQIAGFYFAAPPPTLLPLAPFALLPIEVGTLVLGSFVIGGAIAGLRMLRLPWWWILFPPLVHSMLSGNIQTLLIPLLLGVGGPIAVLLKIYAGLPMLVLGRLRPFVGALAIIVLTVPILPWSLFIHQLPEITARLADQTHYALPNWFLVAASPFALVALATIGREAAAWMVVPALWPSQQYYYGTMCLGTGNRTAVALVALPVPGSGLIALAVLAIVAWRRGGRPGHPARALGTNSVGTIGAVTSSNASVDFHS